MKGAIVVTVCAVALAGFGGVVTNDYSWVRGTHYRINGDAEKTARELGYGRRVGLNAVRFCVSRDDFRKDPNAAAAKYRAFVRQARAQGYWSIPPTARIEAWRKMDEPPVAEVLRFAEALAGKLEEALPKNAQSHRDVVARPLQ